MMLRIRILMRQDHKIPLEYFDINFPRSPNDILVLHQESFLKLYTTMRHSQQVTVDPDDATKAVYRLPYADLPAQQHLLRVGGNAQWQQVVLLVNRVDPLTSVQLAVITEEIQFYQFERRCPDLCNDVHYIAQLSE
jgi:hypothetical protein